MPMSREELLLLQQLKQLSNQVPGFALEFASHEFSVEAEIDFVHQLADMAEALLRHANARRGLAIDGQPAPLVIDAVSVRVEAAPRELPPGRGLTALGREES
jgi:hypothetical protein